MQDDPFFEMLLAEASELMNKANEAGPENADQSYVARAFARLTEAVYRRSHPEGEPDFDLGAVAQTAEAHFARGHQQWYVAQTAQLLMNCLQRAINEEGRKIEFPFLDYDAMSEPADDEFESYGTGYDPLALHKFAHRIVTKGVLRVRGDQDEVYRAILELNEAQFVESSTREEFVKNLADLPDAIRNRRLAEFDAALSAQPQQTPEVVANLLRDERARMIQDYSAAIYRGFMTLSDHSIRCGIIATLFLAAQYANAVNADATGQTADLVERLRPGLTELKKEVAAFFADWLTQPLATKPRMGRKAKADLSHLSNHYGAIINAWRDAYALCRARLGLRSAALRHAWRDDVQKAFPNLPEDLIERLQPMADWPEDVAAICSDQGGEDTTEDIALEHAARMCGADAYAFKLSSLRKTYQKQRGI